MTEAEKPAEAIENPDTEVERPIIITVSNRYKAGNGKETCITDRVDRVEPKKFKTTPAIVKRAYGITLKLGDSFEFARVDVGIEIPCYLQDVKLADKFAETFCEERLQHEVARVRDGDDDDKKESDDA